MLKPSIDIFLLTWAWSLYFTKSDITNFTTRILSTIVISIIVSYCIFNLITIDTLPIKNKKDIIAIDIDNTSSNIINNDYIKIINDLVKVFGAQNVYIIGFYSEKTKWEKIILLEKNNFFNKTGILRKNIMFSIYYYDYNIDNKFSKTKDQCMNLGANYYLGNQINICKNIGNILDHTYYINQDNLNDIKLKIINNIDNGKTKKNIKKIKNSSLIYYYFNDRQKNGYYAIYIENNLPSSIYAFTIVSKKTLKEVGFILKTGEVQITNKETKKYFY